MKNAAQFAYASEASQRRCEAERTAAVLDKALACVVHQRCLDKDCDRLRLRVEVADQVRETVPAPLRFTRLRFLFPEVAELCLEAAHLLVNACPLAPKAIQTSL